MLRRRLIFALCGFGVVLGIYAATCAAQKGGNAAAISAAFSASPAPPGKERQQALGAGRAVAALFAKNNSRAVFARFTPGMAQAVPVSSVESLNAQLITPSTPLEKVVSEMVSGTAECGLQYTGEYGWRDGQNLVLSINFDSSGDRISGLRVFPVDKAANRDAVLRQGRKAAALHAKRDAAALFALFSPDMARAVPLDKVAQVMKIVLPAGKDMGAQLGETVISKGDGVSTYVVENALGDDNAVKLLITYRAGDEKIIGLLLRPGLPQTLPADPHAGYQMKTRLRLPFAPGDQWTIFWGGDTRKQNYHVDYPDQRHAFDIVATKNGKTHDGDGKNLTDYYAWNRQIIAPADAVVSEAVDGLPDNPIGKMDAVHAAGNHVLLRFGDTGEYALLAHLQNGSVRVKTGQTVHTGDVLGLCGNSGNTSEPHLHFHVQDGPTLFAAKGLPITFTHYLSNGKLVESGSPVQGDVVVAAP